MKAVLNICICLALFGLNTAEANNGSFRFFGTIYETSATGTTTASSDADLEVTDLNGKTIARTFTKADGTFDFRLSGITSQTCYITVSKPKFLTYNSGTTMTENSSMPICVTLKPNLAWPQKNWITTYVDNTLQIAYGSGVDYPQFGVLHLNDSYFRLVPTADSTWGTSVITTPSFWTRTTPVDTLPTPGNIRKLQTLGNSIFALVSQTEVTEIALYRSDNLGSSWQSLNIGTDAGRLYDIDCDQGNLYVACDDGVKISNDLGDSFSWDFYWWWDQVSSIDVVNGYGWMTIENYGSKSGPHRKTPESAWSPASGDIEHDATNSLLVVVDPQNPSEIAYLCGGYWSNKYYRTTNAGTNWQAITKKVEDVVTIDGDSVVLSNGFYSLDQGNSWLPSGAGGTIVKDPASNRFFTISNGELLQGTIGNWAPTGLNGLNANVMTICQGMLVTASATNVYRTSVTGVSTYHQGNPITTTCSQDSADLVIDYTTTTAGIGVLGQIKLEPPSNNAIVAHVRVSTTGTTNLVPRKRETFKPVMFSSMHISDTKWDAKNAYINQEVFGIPLSGLLIANTVSGNMLGLTGGTSSWKTNAPTVEFFFDEPLPAEGYVTQSTDPNDDNVGFWPYTNQVPAYWQYTIKATKP